MVGTWPEAVKPYRRKAGGRHFNAASEEWQVRVFAYSLTESRTANDLGSIV